MDFFICHEVERGKPTGSEWTKWDTAENMYELVEVSLNKLNSLPLKPDNVKDKIIKFFEKEIIRMPTCYLICGFLGAGKTTYSQKLLKETGAIHLNPDEWCMKLFSKEEYEQNWNKYFSETIEYLWKKAEEYAKNGKSIIFDMGFWTKLSRDEATQRAKELGFNPVIHFLNVPDEILKQRISARKGAIAEYNLKHFDELKKQFEEPSLDECFIKIDNA